MAPGSKLDPDWRVHPGEILREVLQERRYAQVLLAQDTGYSEKHVSQVICGRNSITPEFALALEKALAMPAEFWLNLQQAYTLHLLRQPGRGNL